MFDELTLDKQVNYINDMLLTTSMRAISTSMDIHKNTIPSLFTKNGYIFDKLAKQYTKNTEVAVSQDKEPILDNSQDHRPVFSIPTKTKTKITNKAFNVVMKESLVDKIDKLASDKGYSRNQLINYICDYFISNMDK